MLYGLYENDFVARDGGRSIDILVDLPFGTSLIATPDDRVWHVAGNLVYPPGFFDHFFTPGTKYVGVSELEHGSITIT